MKRAYRSIKSLIGEHRGVGLVLLAAVMVVYLRTLAPGALGGDPGELQFVPTILSMPHPTGTPLYILLGKVWSMLPLGPSVPWRMNALAAVSAALAVLAVYCTVQETNVASSPAERPTRDLVAWLGLAPALGAALSLAFGLTFWEQALLADKYAFNALMVALILYLALRWGRTRSPATLNLLALTYGLSLAHHRTMALFAPTLLGYAWWIERGALWRDRRRLLRLAALCLAPLALYLYLPWAEARNLPPGTWHPSTPREWYDYLFDTGRTGLVYVDPTDLGEMLLFYARTLLRDFGWPGVLLGVGGLIRQARRRAPVAIFLLVEWVLQAFLAANHHVPRHWVYFIPSFVIWSLWVGEGLSAIWVGVGGQSRRIAPTGMARTGALAILAVVTMAWPMFPCLERYRPLREAHLGAGVLDVWRQTLKTGHMADRVGSAIAGVAPDAVILCDWEQATPLWTYQQVMGFRPDVQIVYPVERLDEMAASGRPLYIARAHAGLADRWYPSCSDSLIALHTAPQFEVPGGATPLGARLVRPDGGAVLELAGYRYGEAMFAPAMVVPLTLYWRAIERPENDYSVSLRLLNGEGQLVVQVDSRHPVLGTYPTSRWTAGQVVGDYYEMQIAGDLPRGEYRWGAVVYRGLPEGGWESLREEGSGAEIALGGAFEVR